MLAISVSISQLCASRSAERDAARSCAELRGAESRKNRADSFHDSTGALLTTARTFLVKIFLQSLTPFPASSERVGIYQRILVLPTFKSLCRVKIVPRYNLSRAVYRRIAIFSLPLASLNDPIANVRDRASDRTRRIPTNGNISLIALRV